MKTRLRLVPPHTPVEAGSVAKLLQVSTSLQDYAPKLKSDPKCSFILPFLPLWSVLEHTSSNGQFNEIY